MIDHVQDDVQIEEPVVEPRRRRLSLGSIMLLGAIVVAGVIFALALARQNQTQPEHGPAPDFEFTTFDGATHQLSDFRGQVVVINFWASWCGPCRDEAPELQSAWEKYENQNVVFLGIAYADNGPKSIAYLDEFGITYLNAPDLGTRISEDYNIQGVPETFVIDQQGNVAQFIYAGVTEHQLSAVIDRLLAEGSA
ncbi:MAG: TlpA family protein disulfide reductase [Anaerolineae bacterium]|nr:TlpA family protein disulfide reductase [Anaerolineae bacterium]